MEMDLKVPGNVLYLESNSLKTVDLDTKETHLIAGKADTRGYREGIGEEARFHAPFSFYQMNGSEVVILDAENRCIRKVSRLTNETSILAGWCTVPGDQDGSFSTANFGHPEKVVEISPNKLAFTDSTNFCIRELDFDQEKTSTLLRLDILLFGLTLRPHTRELYFSFVGGFGSLNLDDLKYTMHTQTSHHGYRDGGLSEDAVFAVRPETLVFITNNIMLVSGFNTHLIRVVNFLAETVSSICDPAPKGNFTRSGDIETCVLSNPRSLLAIPTRNKVLIGSHESIGFMGLYGLPDTILAPTTPSTTVPTTSTSAITTSTSSGTAITDGTTGIRTGISTYENQSKIALMIDCCCFAFFESNL